MKVAFVMCKPVGDTAEDYIKIVFDNGIPVEIEIDEAYAGDSCRAFNFNDLDKKEKAHYVEAYKMSFMNKGED